MIITIKVHGAVNIEHLKDLIMPIASHVNSQRRYGGKLCHMEKLFN